MLQEELICPLISKQMNAMKQDIAAGIASEDMDQYKLLNQYLSNPSSYSTILIKRDSAKKCYYIDDYKNLLQHYHQAHLSYNTLPRLSPCTTDGYSSQLQN